MSKFALKPVVIAVALACVTGFLFGLLNAYAHSHNGTPLSEIDIAMISTTVAGLGLFVGHQMRANRVSERGTAMEEQSAKMFVANRQGTVVYVFRDAFFAKLVGFELKVDGNAVGQTRGKTFYLLTLSPGPHVLKSINPQDQSEAELSFSGAAGQILYFEHSVRFGAKGPHHGFSARVETAGQNRVRRCRLLKPSQAVGLAATSGECYPSA